MLEFLKELNNKLSELDKKLCDLQDDVKTLKKSADDLKSITKINLQNNHKNYAKKNNNYPDTSDVTQKKI